MTLLSTLYLSPRVLAEPPLSASTTAFTQNTL